MSTLNSYLPQTAVELVKELDLIPHPEGGYFRETFRSGSVPMSSRGQTDVHVNDSTMVKISADRVARSTRADQSNRRNALTSIYWVPTVESPVQPLVANLSDHVHYHQGGQAVQYHIYNPSDPLKSVRTVILGPDLRQGHVLQFPVVSGEWKCGRLLRLTGNEADYSLVAEAVGPGFDFHDFSFVTLDELHATQPPNDVAALLRPFLHTKTLTVDDKNVDFDQHYD